MKTFEDWKEIRDWAKDNGWNNLAKRMQLNNDCWASSGEFGRSQVAICDAIRFAQTEEEQMNIAEQLDEQYSSNCGLYQEKME